MLSIQRISANIAFLLEKSTRLRFAASLSLLWCALIYSGAAHAETAPVHRAQERASPNPNSILRFMFTADSFAGIEEEFTKRRVVFTTQLKAPAAGKTTWATGMDSSRFSTPYRIDQVQGRFHVYAERRRPQQPTTLHRYRSQEFVFNTPDQAVAPVGTLTYPKSGSNFPAVVLVAGSGPHNRNSGMSLHNTLQVLADHLTRQGFAVLRYDKRGVGLTGGDIHPGSTTDQYAADALAAVRFLKTLPNIDPNRIGVVGHSEGGIIAAMVAAEAPQDVSFIVMLAGTGLPGIDNQILQNQATDRAEGIPEALIQLKQAHDRQLFQVAASKLGHDEAISAMIKVTDELPADVKTRLGLPKEGLPLEVYEGFLTPWFRRYLELDPRSFLEKVKVPVLALIGEKDLQVPPAENIREIEHSLGHQVSPLTVVRTLPSINHNLQAANTGQAWEYFFIEETVAPSLLTELSAWLTKVTDKKDNK
jgi:uncharacterized protein